MRYLFFILACFSLASCKSEIEGKVLTDLSTGKVYSLKQDGFFNEYLLFERSLNISGKDTSYVWTRL